LILAATILSIISGCQYYCNSRQYLFPKDWHFYINFDIFKSLLAFFMLKYIWIEMK
jgi:hypothetical protein